MAPVLVTGAAGFIGYHVAESLLRRGTPVIGVDNVNHYYDVRLKQARLSRLSRYPAFVFHRVDVSDRAAMERLGSGIPDCEVIVHLAAQAGVRYSLVDPIASTAANVSSTSASGRGASRTTALRPSPASSNSTRVSTDSA